MKALARTLLIALAGAWALGAALPAQADHGHGWKQREHCDLSRGRHWEEYWRPGPAHGASAVIHRPPVVVRRPAVVVYESPVVYERRVYYGPTHYTPYYREPSVSFSFTMPLR